MEIFTKGNSLKANGMVVVNYFSQMQLLTRAFGLKMLNNDLYRYKVWIINFFKNTMRGPGRMTKMQLGKKR